MTTGLYSADCVQFLDWYGAIPPNQSCKREVADLVNQITVGFKFSLPANGSFFDTEWRALPSQLRLPFPSCVLEYTLDGQPRVITLFESGEFISIGGCVLKGKFWAPIHGTLNITRSAEPGIMPDWAPIESESLLNGELQWVATPWPASEGMNATQIDVHGTLANDVLPVLNFLEILACGNVQTEKVPANAFENSKRMKRGKRPQFDYHILTIPGGGMNASSQGGTHASPRQHLRRGHVRRISPARTTWINACIVGSSQNGTVDKDYRVIP